MKKQKLYFMPIVFWLMTIEDEQLREKALQNCEGDLICYPNPDFETYSLSGALVSAFSWYYSPEGKELWNNYYMNLKLKGL